MFVGKSKFFLEYSANVEGTPLYSLNFPANSAKSVGKMTTFATKNSATIEGKHPHFFINNSAGFEVNVWEILPVGLWEQPCVSLYKLNQGNRED